MKKSTVLKLATVLVISIMVFTVFTTMTPVVATPSEADVINTTELSSTIIVGGDKIFLSNYVYNYNPGWPGTRLWRETYYEMDEYDTSTDTKTSMGRGRPLAASSDYLAYEEYYYKYDYVTRTSISTRNYYILDLNTNVKTLWNEPVYGWICDIWENKMSSLLFTDLGKSIYKFNIYVTDLSTTPLAPVHMYTAQATPTMLVKFDNSFISENYIAWMEGNYIVPPPPARYPNINNWPLKLMDQSRPGTPPILLHQCSTTYLSRTVRFGKSLTPCTMNDNIVVWVERDIVTRINELRYIDINTRVKTTILSTSDTVGGANIAGDFIYYYRYNSATRKYQIYEYDMNTKMIASTGIVGNLDSRGNGIGDYVLAMRTSESQYGADLNNDGDTRDYVVRYLYTAIEATIEIHPETLNLRSNGVWITAKITLPDGFDVNDILISTVTLGKGIVADWGVVTGSTLMVKFDRLDVENHIGLPNEAVELTVTGKLSVGIPFICTDTIRAINP